MSKLKQFVSRIENPSTGEIILGTQSDEEFYLSEGYIKCDGSIVSRNTYTTIFQNVDLIQDNLGASATIISSGTSNNILDMYYANNQFVYLDDNNVIGTSSNGVSWTRTSLNIFSEITYVGGKTFSSLGSLISQSIPLTDLTGGVLSAPSRGDIVIVAVATGSTTNRSQAVSGYTQIASLFSDSSYDTNLWVGYKIMGATPDTTITIPATGDGSDAQTVAIQVWRGVDSTIFDVTSTTFTGTTPIVNPPSITTVSSNTVLLVIGAASHIEGLQTFTASYLSNFLTVGSNDTNDSTIGFGSIFRGTAGLYDPAAWSFSGSSSSLYTQAAVTIALRRRTSVDTNKIFDRLLFENGNYFLSGYQGSYARSLNLTSWTTSNIGGQVLTSTFGNNSYVLAGNSGFLVTSTNANTWTTRTSGTSNNITGISNNSNGTFVYVTDNGFYSTSSDTINWATPSEIDSFNIDSFFVGRKAFSRGGNLSTQSVPLTDLSGGLAAAPAANDIVFVAVATGSNTVRSQAVTGYIQIESVVATASFRANLWVGYKIMGATPDTTITIPSTGSVDDAQTVAIQVWRGVDSTIFDVLPTTSTSVSTPTVDPAAITTVSPVTAILIFGAGVVTNGANTYTASYLSDFFSFPSDDIFCSSMGSGYIALTSAQTYDPAAWTYNGTSNSFSSSSSVTVAIKLNHYVNKLSYENDSFVVSGAFNGTKGRIYTSTDGTTWTARTSSSSSSINDFVSYNTTLYVGDNGVFATSPNNITWTTRTSGTSNNLTSVAYGNGTFVLAGSNGTIATYEPYTYNYKTEFKLPTVSTTINQSQHITAYIKT